VRESERVRDRIIVKERKIERDRESEIVDVS
jgi:hypothetical protein